jgi:hypothetical protein
LPRAIRWNAPSPCHAAQELTRSHPSHATNTDTRSRMCASKGQRPIKFWFVRRRGKPQTLVLPWRAPDPGRGALRAPQIALLGRPSLSTGERTQAYGIFPRLIVWHSQTCMHCLHDEEKKIFIYALAVCARCRCLVAPTRMQRNCNCLRGCVMCFVVLIERIFARMFHSQPGSTSLSIVCSAQCPQPSPTTNMQFGHPSLAWAVSSLPLIMRQMEL